MKKANCNGCGNPTPPAQLSYPGDFRYCTTCQGMTQIRISAADMKAMATEVRCGEEPVTVVVLYRKLFEAAHPNEKVSDTQWERLANVVAKLGERHGEGHGVGER